MKGTETFKKTIEDHLNKISKDDPSFAKKLNNKKKSIDKCVTYILNQVKQSGRAGFADEEIFGMAMHYYDEDKVTVGKPITSGSVVVNHSIDLSETEIEEAKNKAKQQVIDEEKARLRHKPKKKNSEKETVEPNLFDSL